MITNRNMAAPTPIPAQLTILLLSPVNTNKTVALMNGNKFRMVA